MPFDATPSARPPLPDNIAAQSVLVLDMVELYFRGGAQWAQGIGSETGTHLCLLGAVRFVRRELDSCEDQAAEYLERAIDLKHPQCRKRLAKAFLRIRAPKTIDIVTNFNDARGRTFAQTLAVLHTARELAATDASASADLDVHRLPERRSHNRIAWRHAKQKGHAKLS
jgi:hypothetical protein